MEGHPEDKIIKREGGYEIKADGSERVSLDLWAASSFGNVKGGV